jgi:hypothetical protein
MTMSGVLLLSHCGFSFMENLAAAVRARGLRVLILSSRPADETPGRLAQLRELADAVLDVPDRHELVEQDVETALDVLRSRGEKVVACLSVWEGYRGLMARANTRLDVQDLDIGTVELLADKLRVRQALLAVGLTRVRAEPATDEALQRWLREARPGFVKPRRGIASFGAQRLRPGLTAHGLAALIESSRSDPVYGSLIGPSSFFIEDHVAGPEFSFEVLALQGRAHLVTVHEKLELTETDTAVLEDSCASPPPGWGRAQHDEAAAWVEALLGALGAGWGCFHIEARRTAQGWELIEANPRAGGALISHSSAAQHGGRSLLDQWLDLLLDQHGAAAERLREGLACQAGHYPNDRATFFRVYFAKPGLITALRRNEMTRTPDSLQSFLEPGTVVPASDREVFAGQALWSFEREHAADAVAHLLIESRHALEIEYGSGTEAHHAGI